MHIASVSGSLRNRSSNTILLKAMSRLASNEFDFDLYGEINKLPHFSPDLDVEKVSRMVVNLRHRMKLADGIIISSPEYAHGVPGVLKNALDWLVSSGEFVDKPVILINVSSRAHHAQEQLVEILTTMAAKVFNQSSTLIPLAGRNLDEDQIIEDVKLSNLLCSTITDFANFIEINKSNSVDK